MVKLFTFLLIISFPLGQLSRVSILGNQINIYFHDFVVVLILFSWLGGKVLKKEKVVFPFLSKPILGFFALASLSLCLALPYFKSRELIVAFFYLLRWLAYAGVYFALSEQIRLKLIIKKQVFNLMILAGVISAVLGLGQYFLFPDIRPLTVLDWDPHYFRVVGTFLDPGFTGLIYVLALILIISKMKRGVIKTLLFLLTYLALALTYSRSSYLSYIISMGLIAKYKKSIKFFSLVLIFGIVTILLLPRPGGEGVRLERKSTILARIENWQQALKISFDHPVFGVGFNTYRYVQKKYSYLSSQSWDMTHSGAGADSSLLFVLATTGILGLAAYLNLLSSIFKQKSKLVNISLVSVLTHSFFNNSLFYAWIMLWLWLILGAEAKEYN